MAFVAATSTLFAPEDFFDALDIPYAEIVELANPVDVSDRLVIGALSVDEVFLAGSCQCGNCDGGVFEIQVAGAIMRQVLARLGIDETTAMTLTKATYWMPVGTVFSVPLSAVRDQN